MTTNEPVRQHDAKLLTELTRAKYELFWPMAIKACEKYDLEPVLFETLRTQERQYWLYGKGRTIVQCQNAKIPLQYSCPQVKPVTWTLESNHLKGEAFDICFRNNEGKLTWLAEVTLWNELYRLAKTCGLKNNAPKEQCHFENDGKPLKPEFPGANEWAVPSLRKAKAKGLIGTDEPQTVVDGLLLEILLVKLGLLKENTKLGVTVERFFVALDRAKLLD